MISAVKIKWESNFKIPTIDKTQSGKVVAFSSKKEILTIKSKPVEKPAIQRQKRQELSKKLTKEKERKSSEAEAEKN